MEAQGAYILTLSCPDRPGIVAAVAGCLASASCNILDSAQYGDPGNGRFFMRVSFAAGPGQSAAQLRESLAAVATHFDMDLQLHDPASRPRVVLMVSRFGHCLNDLLFRHRTGALPVDLVAIVSNHRDFYQLAAAHDIPFHHLPVTPETKPRQEARLLELLAEVRCDLVVLARYMQVLSPAVCAALAGRVINIHHSFLPSFQGARPYHQAHQRGVKLIGATAHYVTEDLDEGPIIEQDVVRAEHHLTPERLAALGRDVECAVLARAVLWHAEHRILPNGTRTVIFK